MKKLNENNDYVRGVASESGVPIDYLNTLWAKAESKIQQEGTEKGNPEFWQEVINEFNQLVDEIDIEEARYVMNTREDYNRTANDFMNHLLDDDYGKADETFGKMVDARLNLMINKERDKFYKNVLSDRARKLAAGE